MKNLPLIGILTTFVKSSLHYKRGTLGIEAGYYELFSQYGKVIIITPESSPEDYAKLDLLVLPGGPDLSVGLQSTKMSLWQGQDNPVYTTFYKEKVYDWIDSGTPMLGFCLGFQGLNVVLGGTLTPHGIGHVLSYPDTHKIAVYSEKLRMKGTALHNVNSRHHQFVRLDQKVNDLAECLTPIGFGADIEIKDAAKARQVTGESLAKRKGKQHFDVLEAIILDDLSKVPAACTNVEAFIHIKKPIAGVQWHPEDMWRDTYTRGDAFSHLLIQHLLKRGADRIGMLEEVPVKPIDKPEPEMVKL